VEADAYATAFMVMGMDSTRAFLKAHPELTCIFIYDENGTYQTDVCNPANNQ